VVSEYDIDWRIEVDLFSQGRTGTSVVNNNGQPFHTTSSIAAETNLLLVRRRHPDQRPTHRLPRLTEILFAGPTNAT
jgi:hypothetical protein